MQNMLTCPFNGHGDISPNSILAAQRYFERPFKIIGKFENKEINMVPGLIPWQIFSKELKSHVSGLCGGLVWAPDS